MDESTNLVFMSPSKRKNVDLEKDINEDEIAHKSRRLFEDDVCAEYQEEYLDASNEHGITNVGQQMLEKLGWKRGMAIGSSGQVANGPIEVVPREQALGLGYGESSKKPSKKTCDPDGDLENEDDEECEDIEDLQQKYGILESDTEKVKAWKRMCVRYRNCV